MKRTIKTHATLCTSNFGGIEISINDDGSLYARTNFSGIPGKWVLRPINEYVETDDGFISTFTLYGTEYSLNDFMRV
jgi:hypothetical protein